MTPSGNSGVGEELLSERVLKRRSGTRFSGTPPKSLFLVNVLDVLGGCSGFKCGHNKP